MGRLIDDFLESGFVTPHGELAIRLSDIAGRSGDIKAEREETQRLILQEADRAKIVAQLALEKFIQQELEEFQSDLNAYESDVKAYLRRTTVIVADNVAEYVFLQSGKTSWDELTDYPCLAPPFDDFWIDIRIPAELKDHETGATFRSRILKHGYHFRRFSLEQAKDIEYVGLPSEWDELNPTIILRADSYIHLEHQTTWGPNERYYLPLDQHGHVLGKMFCIHGDKADHPEQQLAWWFLPPALLTISFLHCKNVLVDEHAPDAKLSKARRRRGKEPHVTYKTLNILPMTKILREEGGSHKTGLKQALHICRGHFKNFQDKGLFGKHKGLYWWDSQVRGRVKEGVVVKGYKVTRSQSENGLS